MANDIVVSKQGIVINNISLICSTLPTGATSKRIIVPNYPANLTIESIENKYDERFDDPSYYYGAAPIE
jgi:hypothetical protein